MASFLFPLLVFTIVSCYMFFKFSVLLSLTFLHLLCHFSLCCSYRIYFDKLNIYYYTFCSPSLCSLAESTQGIHYGIGIEWSSIRSVIIRRD